MENFKLSSDGSDSGGLQMRPWWHLWWSLAESAFGGSLESGDQFCIGVLGRNTASVTVKMF
jgi:hypothetical protein